jgi:hypothetical protein
MWTEEHRRIYRREGNGYPTDIRGARLAPLIPRRRWVAKTSRSSSSCRAAGWSSALSRNRRLAKDFENVVETLGPFVALASIQLALRRFAGA